MLFLLTFAVSAMDFENFQVQGYWFRDPRMRFVGRRACDSGLFAPPEESERVQGNQQLGLLLQDTTDFFREFLPMNYLQIRETLY